jgi:membrane fusion protein, multidrug efflux system
MPKLHRIAALFVLAAASAWVLTGEFTSVGSAQSEGSQENLTPVAEPEVPVAKVKTVAAAAAVFVDHARVIRLSATTSAEKRVALAARTDGVIASLDLIKGNAVAEGTMVMTLEGPETVAQVEIARIALAQSERELVVAERLFAGGTMPETQLTSARSTRDAAKAELARAEAAVDRLQLKAPFSGIVDRVDVELGEWVQTGTPVATILSLDPILVKAEVSEVDLASVRPGSSAKIRLVTGEELAGTVRLIAREATAQTRTFPVEIELANPGNLLSSGMTAEVELLAVPQRAVVVPRSVITLNEDGALGVRIVDADSVARFAEVSIIDDTPEGLVVTGVPDAVRIIVAGQDLVRDGETVEVAAAEAGQ